LTHLQLEALLSAARDSANLYDFALVCLLCLLGLHGFRHLTRPASTGTTGAGRPLITLVPM